jgi:type VI secretion system protein ImpK
VNAGTSSESSEGAQNWLQKGKATLARMARSGAPALRERANPLRELFTDLIAYVIFFDASCEHSPPTLNELREKIVSLLNAQEERAKGIGVSPEAFREARFAVLSWVDEMILNSKWPYRTRWQHLMLVYFGTLNAGEEFFQHLEQLPPQSNNVLEIYYLCLSMGFEGRYAFGDERRELRDLKQRLYKQLCATNGDIRQNYLRLFPEAYQTASVQTAAPRRSKLLLWHIGAFSIPILLFICYWLILRHESDRLLALIQTPTSVPTPAPVPAPIDPLRSLVQELRRKGIPAEDTPRGVLITLGSLLFKSNSTDLSQEAQSKIYDIVDTVKRYAPDRIIVVEGHASKERTVDEARNQQLSEGRARTVADAFRFSGFSSDRISARGFGSRVSVADNETEQGRAKNRRVEIIVRK